MGETLGFLEKKNPKPLCFLGFRKFCCWGTRTRTRKGRTRICSVTITPYPNLLRFAQLSCCLAGAKVLYFLKPPKLFLTFF